LIRIGSRGSQLALWQAGHIADHLRSAGHEVTIQIIRTTGDRMQDIAFAQVGSKGMFTKEIEEALVADEIDLAVHSLKDLPTELAPPFALAAIPARVDPRDAFVSVEHATFDNLPQGARVGTSSLRRQAQLRARRSDLVFIEFRGNVDTRLRKLSEGQADAIVLASAGLERLGKTEWLRERFPASIVCPAAGQGALAIETRADDEATQAALAFLDHPATRFAVTAERIALAALGGGCQVPIGVHCQRLHTPDRTHSGGHAQTSSAPAPETYTITGTVAAPDGSRILRAEAQGTDATTLGRSLSEKLLSQGAAELLISPSAP
jgi:hydroxymethylbilane synthase